MDDYKDDNYLLEKADMRNKEAKEDYKETTRVEQGRFRYIAMSGSFIIKLLTGRLIGDSVVTMLPEDSRFIRAGVDSVGTVFLVFESQQFEMVYSDGEIPFHGHLQFKRNP